ncbi:MAG: hypothetical protein WBH47_13505 [Streptosporangiaceae bacterium]
MSVVLWVIIAIVIVGIVIALFGWDRYRGNRRSATQPSAAQPTDEVFMDPETGKRTRVWYNPATGQREYRAE